MVQLPCRDISQKKGQGMFLYSIPLISFRFITLRKVVLSLLGRYCTLIRAVSFTNRPWVRMLYRADTPCMGYLSKVLEWEALCQIRGAVSLQSSQILWYSCSFSKSWNRIVQCCLILNSWPSLLSSLRGSAIPFPSFCLCFLCKSNSMRLG